MQYISDFSSKKVIEYLKPGMTVRIDYPHGLGDVLMFLPYSNQLQIMYPDIVFHLKTTPDKQNIIGELPSPCDYDYVFYLPAHFNEGGGKYKGMTKPECNCIFDLGIAYDKNLEYKDVQNIKEEVIQPITEKNPLGDKEAEEREKALTKSERSLLNLPLVGFSFFSTHFPKEIDCRERFAEYLWNRTIQEGYVPIELQFFQSGDQHNIMRRRFNFATNTTRQCKPDASRLISLVKACRGIASVATGTYHLGMTLMPENTLYLGSQWQTEYFTNKPDLLKVDVRKSHFDEMATINKWFQSMK